MAYTFDGASKLIILTGTTTLDLVDLHARWKDWILAGNASVVPAFRAVGGDIPAIPLYLFLLNGWRIRPMEASHSLTVYNGLLEVDGGGEPFVDPLGNFKVRINRQSPGIAIGYSTSGGSGPTAESIAAAVLAALNATTIPVDVQKMNSAEVIGDGSEAEPWRGLGVSV